MVIDVPTMCVSYVYYYLNRLLIFEYLMYLKLLIAIIVPIGKPSANKYKNILNK